MNWLTTGLAKFLGLSWAVLQKWLPVLLSPAADIVGDMLPAALRLVREADAKFPGAGRGADKRHYVMRGMAIEFVAMPERFIRGALEAAVVQISKPSEEKP